MFFCNVNGKDFNREDFLKLRESLNDSLRRFESDRTDDMLSSVFGVKKEEKPKTGVKLTDEEKIELAKFSKQTLSFMDKNGVVNSSLRSALGKFADSWKESD